MSRLPLQGQEGLTRRSLARPLGLALVAASLAGLLGARTVAAAGKPVESLRAVADRFVASGDLDGARQALAAAHENLDDLLATLREPRVPAEAPVAGEHTLEIEDGFGRKTDLCVVAPSAEALAARHGKPLGLAILLHGLGGTYTHMLPLARALAATGEIVAACPTAQKLPDGQGGEDGVPADFVLPHWWLYESTRSFPLEAIRRVSALYTIDPDRVVISGHSMGGYGSYNIALRHPDRFAGVAPLAGGINRLPYGLDHDHKTAALLGNAGDLAFFVVHGTADHVVRYDADEGLVARLKKIAPSVDWRPLENVGHGVSGVFAGVGAVGKDLVRFLSTGKRVASPERVSYSFWGDSLDGAYWVRVLERSPEQRRPEVSRIEARVDRSRNAIRLSAVGVTRARVYIDDRLLDLSKPVRIEVKGAVKFEGKVTRSLEAVLESWRSRGDPGLVYPAFVDVDPRVFD